MKEKNRYAKAIESLVEIMLLREEIKKHSDIVRKNLTVKEFFKPEGIKFEKNLLDQCFEGLHVKGTPYYIQPENYVKSSLVMGNGRLYLHEEPDKALSAVLPALLAEVNLKAV
tara:strand:+ start:621 stop:959 length:339 start_codon:yes stop_codon:yes gene_type:complete